MAKLFALFFGCALVWILWSGTGAQAVMERAGQWDAVDARRAEAGAALATWHAAALRWQKTSPASTGPISMTTIQPSAPAGFTPDQTFQVLIAGACLITWDPNIQPEDALTVATAAMRATKFGAAGVSEGTRIRLIARGQFTNGSFGLTGPAYVNLPAPIPTNIPAIASCTV